MLRHLMKHVLPLIIIVLFAKCCRAQETTPEQDGYLATTVAPDTFDISNCNLQVDVPDIVRENLLLEDKSVHFVYANLEFANQDVDPKTGHLSNETRYITPLRWVVASGRRGNLFLGLPAIFEELSLWTLGLEVLSAKVTITTDGCTGFMNATDAAKQELVSSALYESINTTGLPDFKVCQEVAHLPDALLGDATWVALIFNIYFVVYNTRHECWYQDGEATLSTKMFAPPAWLLPPTITLGIIGAIVLPLIIIRFVQRNNSPLVKEVCKRDENGVRVGTGKVRRYYNRSTSLPVGLKYILCYHSTSLVEVLRAVFLCVLFYIILCPEIFFPLDTTYRLRFHAYRRNGFLVTSYTEYHVVRTVLVLLPLLWFLPAIPMLCRIAYKWRRFKLADIPTGVRPYHAESVLERSYFGLFPIPDIEDRIQPHPTAVAGLSCLYYYMVTRIKSALDFGLLYRCYAHSLIRVWDCVMMMMWCDRPQSLWEIMSCASCIITMCVIMPLLVPFYLILLFFSIFIYLLPSAYVLLCVTNTHAFIISFADWVYRAGFWSCYEGHRLRNDDGEDDEEIAMETRDEEASPGGKELNSDDGKDKKSEVVVIGGVKSKDDDSKDDQANKVSKHTETKDDDERKDAEVAVPTANAEGDAKPVAMPTGDAEGDANQATEASNVVLDSGAKQTVVEFRPGSNPSGVAYTEHVYHLHGVAVRHYHKFWPLRNFYHNVYKSLVGDPGQDQQDGQGRSLRVLWLEVVFVLFAVVYTTFCLVAIALIVFLLEMIIGGIVTLLSSLFVIYFFRFVALCTLLGTVMLLSFVGLVMNTLRVMPYCMLSLSLFGFVVSVVTTLYGGYVKMLRMVIERCRTLRKDLCFVSVERRPEGDEGDEIDVEEDEADEDVVEDDELPSVIASKKKMVNLVVALEKLTSDETAAASDDADVMIEERLLWHVADRCRPLRLLVVSGIMQVIAVVLAVTVGIIVLVDIGELQDFTHFGVTLCILVITLLITHVRSLIALTEEEETDDFERAVKKAVVGFDAGKKDKQD